MQYDKIIELFKQDIFAIEMGAEIIELYKGGAKARVTIEKKHLNAGGITQGGVIFTLADYAMAAAANGYGKLSFSIQNDIKYLLSAPLGSILTAIATEVSQSKMITNYTFEIKDQDNRLIAVGSSTLYRKDIDII